MIADYERRIQAGDRSLQPLLDQLKLNFKSGPSLPFLDVWFKDEKHGLAVGSFGMAAMTDDGGVTWKPALDRIDDPEFLHLNAVREVAGNVYISAEKGTVFRFDRNTQRFVPVSTGYGGSFFGVAGNAHVLLAYGLRGTVYRSTNGGSSWEPLPSPLHTTITSCVYVEARQSFVAATAGGEVAVIDDSGRAFHLLSPLRTMMFTGVQPLPDGDMVLSGLAGLTSATLH
jgi:photosystem II stability/assembly factor-like uncharacterized protein